jgi:hypothetical protein
MGVHRGREDAFGSALFDHLMDRTSDPVMIERDDGLVEAHDVSGYFWEFRRWGSRAGSHAMGSGPGVGRWLWAGRVALHLQRRSHPVMGIDVSTLAVKVCKFRGVEAAQVVSVTQAALERSRPS